MPACPLFGGSTVYLAAASEWEKIDVPVSSHGLSNLSSSTHVGTDSGRHIVGLQHSPHYLGYGYAGQWGAGSAFPGHKIASYNSQNHRV